MAKGGGSTRTVNSRKASASRTNKVNNDAFSTNMLTQKEQETYDRLSKVKNKYSNVYERLEERSRKCIKSISL